ncbi:hypothetical protein GUJ93_ZPchr0013g35573 [Zizania palustris]|uniref:C2H2-type domain-containing protein n=1 Tax=Zizania palustris TaxID=103762 RepID=A0A8J5WXV9_ZIZPA|nr:hypothetical protein GUJ93_ZPchr0013g35573 [Zizania palustris]
MDDAVELSSSSSARHSCKVCGKGFPSGRSLGGHMRSHSPAGDDDADADEGDEKIERRWMHSGVRVTNGVGGVGGGGYDLRENPKKTRRRLSGSGGGDDRGDLFFSSCRTVFGQVHRHAPGGRVCAEDAENVDANVDEGPEEMLIPGGTAVVMPAPRRRRRTMRVPAPVRDADTFHDEPEDVARCLVMLSRDTNGIRDSTSKQEKTKPTPGAAGEKRSRYECPCCGRGFQSYQALGGHRASHKRINSNCSLVKAAEPDQPAEPRVETDASFSTASTSGSPDVEEADDRAAALQKSAKKAKAISFECPICYKAFGSGQALGGHKRSHSIAGELDRATDSGIVQPEQSPLAKRFLDLNLPAPGAD